MKREDTPAVKFDLRIRGRKDMETLVTMSLTDTTGHAISRTLTLSPSQNGSRWASLEKLFDAEHVATLAAGQLLVGVRVHDPLSGATLAQGSVHATKR